MPREPHRQGYANPKAHREARGEQENRTVLRLSLLQGTIKAIEQGKTDARLSTLRKLARTFTAHGVEFVMEGARSGVTIQRRISRLSRVESTRE